MTSDIDSNLVRLNKFIAQCGVASRRGADDLIAAGKVQINGEVIDSPGVKVNPSIDKVQVSGRELSTLATPNQVYIILNKPVQVVTTASDPQGRKTVLDILPQDIRRLRPFPVGRLDYFSEGLLLLTTDGDLCHRLTHPRWHLPKVYRVTVQGMVHEGKLETMRNGMTLSDGKKLAPVKVNVIKSQGKNALLEMTLIQGVNRQIRRMCRDLDLQIQRLTRISQGPVSLGKIPSGKWRALSENEITALKRAVGLSD